MIKLDPASALVLFSGGQDSTTCLAWALDRFARVETVGFDYGQRHRVELEQRLVLLRELKKFPQWAGKIGEDRVLQLDALAQIGQSAMIESVAIETAEDGLPTTFVPGRNILFLTAAAALAYRRGTKHIVTGVCETDYSGYPDCRDDTIKSLQASLNLGMESNFVLHTPLMWLSKAQTWQLAEDLGRKKFIDVIRQDTHTCYLGDRTNWHEWGYGCGECPACQLRASGWNQYKTHQNSDISA